MKIVPSWLPKKKLAALFDDGTVVHFGGKGCGDYTIYWKLDPALARRKRHAYISRHAASGSENWMNPKSPGALSRWILWEKPTVSSAIRAYKKMFRLA